MPTRLSSLVIAPFVIVCAVAQAGLAPNPVLSSEIFVRVTAAGTMPSSSRSGALTNATSPAVAGGQLLLIDQRGYVFRRDAGGAILPLLTPSSTPAALTPIGERVLILNVAANMAADRVYVVFMSSTLPPGMSAAPSPRPNASAFQVVYEYAFDGAVLTLPRAVAAFDVYPWGHTGGGLLVAPDGSLLFAIGDNGDSGEDGRAYAQDDTTHLSKIVRIDVGTGAWTILAKGVRNVQRLELSGSLVVFTDMGGAVAEELNAVPLASLLDTNAIENFGWGRNAVDSLAREGTFYIAQGGQPTGTAPSPEPGFIQPVAQWGRELGARFVAATGPASGSPSFSTIDSLFGDLVSGYVLAIRAGIAGITQNVFRVNLVDAGLHPTTLAILAGGRPDPRFFKFPDGRAGVLLERTGQLFEFDELPRRRASQSISNTACGNETIVADSGSARLGRTMALHIDNGAPGRAAAVLMNPAARAPTNLTVIGMPGCLLHLRAPSTFGAGSYRKLPRQGDSSKVEFLAVCNLASLGVRSPSESCCRSSLYSSLHRFSSAIKVIVAIAGTCHTFAHADHRQV